MKPKLLELNIEALKAQYPTATIIQHRGRVTVKTVSKDGVTPLLVEVRSWGGLQFRVNGGGWKKLRMK